MRGNAAVLGALFAELDALGVREFCVCAGARNAPVIEALAQRQHAFTLRHFFDERAAAFFALGRAMKTRTAVAVLTTSGTAAAELLPAVVEAHYQKIPLVMVTADRPTRYAGSGAPQAIEQRGLFGVYAATVEFTPEAPVLVQESQCGPLHFNVRLEEGLCELPGTEPTSEAGAHATRSSPASEDWREFSKHDEPAVVLAAGIHPDDVPAVARFLRELNAPVVAEATANLHLAPELKPLLLKGGERALQNLNARRVLRIGAVPSWRWWRDLDACEEVPVLNITRAPFRGLARTTHVTTLPWEAILRAECGVRHTEPVKTPEAGGLEALLDLHHNSEPAWMRHVSRIIGADATVFLGNSLPIREWNFAADEPRHGTAFFANRGVNGIDGLLSTWLGVSADAKEAWCVLGDLSALYDMNAPWILPQLPAAKRRIVIINNGGGGIFSQVRWLEKLSPAAGKIMKNPHAIGFEPWAKMWDMEYRRFTDVLDLSDDSAESAVWEICPDPEQTSAFWSAWRKS